MSDSIPDGQSHPTSPGVRRLGLGLPLGEISTAGVAVGAAIFYALGFIIINAHLQSYNLLKFESIRVRYFAAATLFLVLTVTPATVTVLAGRQSSAAMLKKMGLREAKEGEEGATSIQQLYKAGHRLQPVVMFFKLILSSVLGLLLGQIAALSLWFFLLGNIDIGDFLLTPTAWAYFGISTSTVFIASSVLPTLIKRSPTGFPVLRKLDYDHVNPWLIYIVALMIGAGAFGRWIYPHVQPAFGGGGVWSAQVTPTAEPLATVPLVRNRFSQPVLVLEGDKDFLVAVFCDSQPRGTNRLRGLEIPRSAIAAIEVDSLVALPRFAVVCRTSDSRGSRGSRRP